jgi:hypothetical protein
MTEYYKQDEFQVKMNKVREEIKIRLGENTLNLIISYGFKRALSDSRELRLNEISDILQKSIAFSRLERFRTEYALLEILDFMKELEVKGYKNEDIQKYFSKNRIEDLVVFE